MVLGSLAQTSPDIDFIAFLWNDASSNLLAHRGFTHSLLFLVFASLFYTWIVQRFWNGKLIAWHKWALFFALQISVHLLLDVYNSYGTGLLEPFHHGRFSFNALYVSDPFFTIWPIVSFIALMVIRTGAAKRKLWWRSSIVFCTFYLIYCSFNKIYIQNKIENLLASQSVIYEEVLTTPTPFNNWLWFVVAKQDSGFYAGYYSVFDDKEEVQLTWFPQNKDLLSFVKNSDELNNLVRFSQGYYTVEKHGDTLVFNDLRFGQIAGWHDPKSKFAFYYFLDHPSKDNRTVVQRGRIAGWNKQTITSLFEKIRAK
jgi:inner membrane protein